ncbi:MAG TPA: ZPR1 zinc finger domain-containing protein [Methanocella sp.]|nr:ZPR1 zinc finger domain-containing protein [Methanocella sp.]
MENPTDKIDVSAAAGTIHCPVCHCALELRWHQDDIPYFGEVMEISTVCACGFRYADTLILGQKEPTRHSLKVATAEHLCTRVIRSTSGTVRIPEWGLDIEPGPASEAYVSNVEGILDRVEGVVAMARKWAEKEEEVQRADALLAEIYAARGGRARFTLVIEDPLGNSAIVDEGVCVERLTPEEAEGLQTGMFIIQKE